MQKATHPSRLRNLRWTLATVIALLTLFHVQLHAQQTQGSVDGTVKDSKGALVPGATVTLTNTDEGAVRSTTTTSNGGFSFQDAKAAHYNLVVEAPGFETWRTDGFVLEVRQQLHLDATLAIGSVQQQVTVSADAASAIETESPTISGTFTSDDATNLPVNTRASFSGTSAFAILGALPGMQADGNSGSNGFSLQGALPFQTDVTVDGVTLKDPGGSNILSESFPSTESISEIRADGALNSAEYGEPGQVIVTTKGGTNQFHGAGFWYYQSSDFDAIAYTNPTTTTKPSLIGNTFGASAGGPVEIPHLYNGHNKSFFYGAYEGWRHPSQVTQFAKVPSTLMKQGDFSKYSSSSLDGAPDLVDPFTGANLGTALPSGLINKISSDTLSTFFPDPNIGDPTAYTDDGTPNWEKNVDASAHSDQFDIRGDQYFGSNQKLLLWGRFTWKNDASNAYAQYNLPSYVDSGKSRVLKVDANWSIKPNLINEGSFGFTRWTSTSVNPYNGTAWTSGEGWVGLQDLWFNGLPDMGFNNLTGLTVGRLNSPSKSYTYDYNDVLIWSKGRHTIKAGVNVQTVEAYSTLGFQGDDNYGTYYFNKSNSSGLFEPVDFADFLLGTPYQSFYDVVRQDNDGVSFKYHAFAQDEWRVSPRLTLSYGLRYELQPGYYDRGGDIGNFNTSPALSGGIIYPDGKQSLLAQAYLASANACDPDGVTASNSATVNGAPCMPVQDYSQAGFPQGLRKYPKLRFMPRLGFAYRPTSSDNWVVRGGYGIYNNTLGGSAFYSLTGTIQAATATYTNSYNASTHAVGFQWPNVYAGSNGACTNCYGSDYFGTANSTNWKDPYTEQWSLSIDHDLGSGYAARITYIGSETHQLIWAPDENTLPYSSTVSANNEPLSASRYPNWGVINTRATGADASYESVQLEASHRLQHGLEFHSTYTFAKALADNQGPAENGFAGENGGNRSTTPFTPNVDFGNVGGTRRHRWNTTVLYDLPFGRGKMFGSNMARAADLLIGGWRLTSILTVQSGDFETPYFDGGEGDPSGTGSGLGGTLAGASLPGRAQHADDVPGVSRVPNGRTRFNWTNGAAFACPGDPSWTLGTSCTTGAGYDSNGNPLSDHPLPIGRFGGSQVGSVVGPNLVNLSSGLSKSFAVTERVHLKVEGTFTNVLNHTNLNDPNLDLSSSSFGVINNAISADFGGARTGQVSARLEF
ncbi:carboxypeptidase regulatory-like domain-containing protein [Acidicapsa dinghuensis]|uniref:Carboxypeptidase regulatory-like domain-containing protein n=1 Tax=Acidicapsa dinghuensis TaxID=2218256 RepID=A0ABW1EM94_9BACT|nr:TonB-dependent receptor [Acidicapsa dinghuensis]